MKQTEALKLALEALESMKETLADHDEPTTFNEDKAITAIKEALAQPEQEHDLQDTRCKCCGYMTYHREHMGCIRAAKPEQEPVAHCEAGPEYCWKCNEEMKPTYGSEEIRKLREANKRLSDHIVDANKMLEALREIGDIAHDKSTGPSVPDVLWEIRAIAYDAIVEFKLMEDTTPPQRKWVGLTDDECEKIWRNLPYEVYAKEIRMIEKIIKDKNT